MAWTTPSTASVGGAVTAALWNSDVRDNFVEVAPLMTAWVTHTPTIAQGVTANISKTVNYSKYMRVGKLMIWQFAMDITGAGTSGASVTLTLPANLAASFTGVIGYGTISDASTSTNYNGSWLNISNLAYFVGDWSGVNTWGSNPSIALANTDNIRGTVVYEVA